MLESELNPEKRTTVRVQANELRHIGLHKFESESQLKHEWKTQPEYYEGKSCQRVFIPCKVFSKVQPFQTPTVNIYSVKSVKSVYDEPAELSLYPQAGFIEDRSVRSRPTLASPIQFGSNRQGLPPFHSNNREDGNFMSARLSLPAGINPRLPGDDGLGIAFTQLSKTPGRLTLSPCQSEQPGNHSTNQEEHFSNYMRRAKTDTMEGDQLFPIEKPQSKKTEQSRTQPSTLSGRSRSRL